MYQILEKSHVNFFKHLFERRIDKITCQQKLSKGQILTYLTEEAIQAGEERPPAA